MWMVNPQILCKQHLMGEYREHFAIAGTMRLKRNIFGYIRNNLIEPKSIQQRYDSLRSEMLSRGYNPVKEFISPDISYLPESVQNYKVDVGASLDDLLSRCTECKNNHVLVNDSDTYRKG
jgi:hypothetical protein|tara:strand:+ start:517 stop:876 length:360 start_codon:yes stop_codon:yes gene_type:complete